MDIYIFFPGNHSLMQEWHIAEVRKINDVYRRSEHTNLCQKPKKYLHMFTLHCCILLKKWGPQDSTHCTFLSEHRVFYLFIF